VVRTGSRHHPSLVPSQSHSRDPARWPVRFFPLANRLANQPERRVLVRQKAATLGALALLAQLVEHLHGKEGVDGSSPSEGFHEVPAPGLVLLAVSATSEDRDVHQTSTARSRARPLP
jgi:hypothetical protein